MSGHRVNSSMGHTSTVQTVDQNNAQAAKPQKYFYVAVFLLLLFAVPMATWGQADLGAITGTVTDSSGAVIPAVSVTAIQLGTGVEFKAVSNNLGFYTLVNLPIGNYTLAFQKSGFKDLNRSSVVVQAQHEQDIDAIMQVGNEMQTVTVTGTPVLDIQTEVGTNMNDQELTDLPTSIAGTGRDITSFAFAVTPNVTGGEWVGSIGGSQAFSKSVLIDGTSVDSGIVGHIQESEPSLDAIQEAQVDTTGLRAEDGRSGGGAFLYELKSGTNRFHGASFGFLQNESLNANDWTDNWYLSQCASGNKACIDQYRRAYNRYFDYGFSGGGPVWKKWLGLKKMYVFAAYEKYMQADWQATPNGATVPTTKMLNGDFSELLSAAATANGCATSPCPIMNGTTPFTDPAGNTIYYGSIFNRQGDVYAGNIITDPISSVAQNIVKLYQADYKPTLSGVTNNYPAIANNTTWFHQTQFSIKYDWDVRSDDHIAASYIYTLRPRKNVNPGSSIWEAGSTSDGGPLTYSQVQTVIAPQYRISETHTFSPHLVNVAGYTFNSFYNKAIPTNMSQNWTNAIGLGNIDPLNTFPRINFSGSPNGLGETAIGNTYGGIGYVAYNAIVTDNLSWTRGRHSMKFGTEIRELGFNADNDGGNLTFTFSNNTFAPTNPLVQGFTGSAFANFLLGQVQSASQQTSVALDSRRKELAFYGQDDIRITRRLTASADLRWELTRPLNVIGGKWANFNVTTPNLAYNNLPGAETWLSHPNGTFETDTDWHQLGPKFGLSYQITSKLVARSSYGINFVPIGWNTWDGIAYSSDLGYQGINQVVEVAPQTPAFDWDKGYPGVYTPPTGPLPATSSYIPWGPSSVDPHTRQLGFTENWFAGVEYELPSAARLEISYMGNSGRNLHDGGLVPTNHPTWNNYQPLLNSGHVGDWIANSANAATAGVPYPYSGFTGPAYFAIEPYPQVWANTYWGIWFSNSPIGQSGYNAFTIEGIKQRGALNFDLSYNWARTTGNTFNAFIDSGTLNYWWQDPYKYKWEAHWPQTNETAKGYLTYVLPLGQGRKYLSSSRLLNYFVGGWTAGTIVSYGNGGQLGAVGSTNSYPGWSAVYTNVASNASFKNQFHHYNPGWNPTAPGAGSDPGSLFVNPSNFSNPTYGQLGNSPTIFSNWRNWAAPSENASLLKKTHFGEDGRFTMTLRAEFYDLLNRHYWNGPNTNFGSAYFGHVTGAYGNRTGQLGARFEW